MRRGEVWWAELPAPAGRRPVLLLSRDEAYLVRELVTVAPLTTRVRQIPSEVPLGPGDGVPKTCVVNLDTITTIPRRTLTERLTPLSPIKLAAIDRAVRFSLGLGEPAGPPIKLGGHFGAPHFKRARRPPDGGRARGPGR